MYYIKILVQYFENKREIPMFRSSIISSFNINVFQISWRVPTNRDETTWLTSQFPLHSYRADHS